MTLLVTGSAGFIGSCFVRQHFLANNELLVSLDALNYAGHLSTLSSVMNHPRHVFVQGDIENGPLLDELLARHQPRAVVHFAAQTHVDRSISNAQAFIQTNVLGTFCLLEAVRKFVGSLPPPKQENFRFLHVSTDEVYGSLSTHAPACVESTAYAPNNPYAASKAASDHLVRAWHHTHKVPAVISHSANNHGPYQFPEKLIPLVVKRALCAETLPLYGNGQQVRDWLFVEDHVRALVCVLSNAKPGEVYHIGARAQRTNLAVVTAICAMLDTLQPRVGGGSYLEQLIFVQDRLGHDTRYALDPSKLEQTLGWKAQETFESGLQKTVQWCVNNLSWLKERSTP